MNFVLFVVEKFIFLYHINSIFFSAISFVLSPLILEVAFGHFHHNFCNVDCASNVLKNDIVFTITSKSEGLVFSGLNPVHFSNYIIFSLIKSNGLNILIHVSCSFIWPIVRSFALIWASYSDTIVQPFSVELNKVHSSRAVLVSRIFWKHSFSFLT